MADWGIDEDRLYLEKPAESLKCGPRLRAGLELAHRNQLSSIAHERDPFCLNLIAQVERGYLDLRLDIT
jgi:hypothetical protein